MADQPIQADYEVLEVLDAMPLVDDDLAVVVLVTDKGRVGLAMKRDALVRLKGEIQYALDGDTSRVQKK